MFHYKDAALCSFDSVVKLGREFGAQHPGYVAAEIAKGAPQAVVGRRAFGALATGLASGVPVYVRVASYNSVGDGGWTFAGVPLAGGAAGTYLSPGGAYPAQPQALAPAAVNAAPLAAVRVDAAPRDATALLVSFATPTGPALGGGALLGFAVQADVSRSFDSSCGEAGALQRVTFGSATLPNAQPTPLGLSLSVTLSLSMAADGTTAADEWCADAKVWCAAAPAAPWSAAPAPPPTPPPRPPPRPLPRPLPRLPPMPPPMAEKRGWPRTAAWSA
jgi:hypothetical protein